jgi:hypothetical protein
VSLSFQLPAIDGLGTGFLIFNVIFFLFVVMASLTASVSRRTDLWFAAAEGPVAR